MAITLTPPATGVLAARNRQVFGLETDTYITTAGGLSEWNKPLNTLPPDGETFIVAWGTHSVTFTFKTTPTDEKHFKIKGNPTLQVTEMVAVLNRNYEVFTDFLVYEAAAFNLHFLARATGAAYDITFSGTSISNGRFLSGVFTAGVDEVRVSPFDFYIDLYQGTTKVIEETAKPDSSQQATYEPAEILLAYLVYDMPAYNASTVATCANCLKAFTLKVWEYYNDAATAGETYGPFYAHLGGLPEKDIPGTDYDDEYFTSALAQKFLVTIYLFTLAGIGLYTCKGFCFFKFPFAPGRQALR